ETRILSGSSPILRPDSAGNTCSIRKEWARGAAKSDVACAGRGEALRDQASKSKRSRPCCTITGMSAVTRILDQIQQGDPHAAEQLLPLVYDELRKLAAHRLAQEKPGQTLQATALVHEAYLRLVDVDRASRWNSRGHFFAAAAEAMRRILVDNARRKQRPKHG